MNKSRRIPEAEISQQSPQFTSVLLYRSPNPIMVADADLSIRYVNPSLEKLSGFTLEEVLGCTPPYPWWCEETLAKSASDFKEYIMQGKASREEVFRSKKGRKIYVDIVSDQVCIEGYFKYYVSHWIDITGRKRTENKLKRINKQILSLSAHMERVRENERSRIAREIHDELGQALTILKMDLHWIKNKLNSDQTNLIEKTIEMSNLADTNLETLKRICAELRPQVLDDLGLSDTILWMAKEYEKKSGTQCRVSVNIDSTVIDRECSTAIFRIFQEALTNISRHSNASIVTIKLQRNLKNVVLTMQDNGCGIEKGKLSRLKTFGILGMKERAHYLGGNISINGLKGKGTTVIASIPVVKKGKC